jgi:precorrin-8X/cobalt-precorrin-8 methylmutase
LKNLSIFAEGKDMAVQLQQVAPNEIEAESFKIISGEFGSHTFDDNTYRVIQRVIHATGDFSFKDNMRFAPGAIVRGIKAIRAGKNILTDVSMVAAGISKTLLGKWGGKVICRIGDEEVATLAAATKKTRSEVAIDLGLTADIGIIAIGNAPTALVQAIHRVAALPPDQAPLIVGIPVGFVNAAESKALLVQENSCYITSLGRKGGSPVAAAIVNALIRLAIE